MRGRELGGCGRREEESGRGLHLSSPSGESVRAPGLSEGEGKAVKQNEQLGGGAMGEEHRGRRDAAGRRKGLTQVLCEGHQHELN